MPERSGNARWIWVVAVLGVAVTLWLSAFSSPLPDGLERTAEVLAFDEHAVESQAPDLSSRIGSWPARLGGVALAALIAIGFAKPFQRRR